MMMQSKKTSSLPVVNRSFTSYITRMSVVTLYHMEVFLNFVGINRKRQRFPEFVACISMEASLIL